MEKLKPNIEERIYPLHELLREFAPTLVPRGVEFRIKPPRPFQGCLDNFAGGPNNRGSKYMLVLDKNHKKFDYWNGSLNINGKSFDFTPTQNFYVRGKISKSGEVNGLKYYFVKVSESSRGK